MGIIIGTSVEGPQVVSSKYSLQLVSLGCAEYISFTFVSGVDGQ
jgi:hypothetical protein